MTTRIEEIEKRMSVIKTELNEETADLDALQKEVTDLKEERKAIEAKVEQRKALVNEVAHSEGLPVIKQFKEERVNQMDKVFTTASPEYRSAFFKRLAEEELSDIEQRAYTHTTANTGDVLPAETIQGIWNLVEEQHSILGDITLYRTGTIIEIVKHTAIVAGDAAIVSEATAGTDEQNTFVKVTLSGKDFSKHVEISYALGRMNGVALEQYLQAEIADRIGYALADEVVAQLGTDMDATNKALTTAAANVVAWADLVKAFGSIKNAGAVTVYVNNSTLYNRLVSIVDDVKRPIFQPSMQAGAQGVLLGAQVKVEESLADDVILVGDAKKVIGNMIQDITIETDKDIKRHVDIFAGYARFECALVAPKAFAKLTVTPGV